MAKLAYLLNSVAAAVIGASTVTPDVPPPRSKQYVWFLLPSHWGGVLEQSSFRHVSLPYTIYPHQCSTLFIVFFTTVFSLSLRFRTTNYFIFHYLSNLDNNPYRQTFLIQSIPCSLNALFVNSLPFPHFYSFQLQHIQFTVQPSSEA